MWAFPLFSMRHSIGKRGDFLWSGKFFFLEHSSLPSLQISNWFLILTWCLLSRHQEESIPVFCWKCLLIFWISGSLEDITLKSSLCRWGSRPKAMKEFAWSPAANWGRTGRGSGPPICSPSVGLEKQIVFFDLFLFLSAKHLTRVKKHRLISFPNLFRFHLSRAYGTEPFWSLSKYFLNISTCCLVGLMSITDDPLMFPAQWTIHYYSDYYRMLFGKCSFPLIFKIMCIQQEI